MVAVDHWKLPVPSVAKEMIAAYISESVVYVSDSAHSHCGPHTLFATGSLCRKGGGSLRGLVTIWRFVSISANVISQVSF